MAGEQPALDAAFVPPQTPMEQEVARLWTEILDLDRLGIHDNFFDIGGHSLRATQVITRLSQLFQVDLPLRLIFEAPTVASLAVAIMHLLAEQDDATEVLQIIAELNDLSENALEV
jgi:acyl carrier protein